MMAGLSLPATTTRRIVPDDPGNQRKPGGLATRFRHARQHFHTAASFCFLYAIHTAAGHLITRRSSSGRKLFAISSDIEASASRRRSCPISLSVSLDLANMVS